ncbi:serine/threonine protein phosphatase [Actinoplanes sp. LDG1-06]|uniref:Serine/threonine protein phosphatase n=1 Tax=Paractinoplanes ovalisporus TaxID=2810368 RepID=A0ABS2ALC9_9ACTN|nr:serine/threonine protein phosphatase [Actinoplanes ovalisporus]MBM2620672.1 serine/threonine protein phosphatase [Actinoplanes ovalisporus]
MHLSERIDRHRAAAQTLAALDDSGLSELLARASAPTAGFGGSTASVDVAGVPTFVKHVPLTELERRTGNVGSTANLFGLPTFYQYGFGSTGFGVWREVAVHTMTTEWVLEGGFGGFPLLHHWRIRPEPPGPADAAELERWVKHWDGDEAVRSRLEAISAAPETVVLFMEHIPSTVDQWLARQGDDAYAFVDRLLHDGSTFMRARGMTHFDAHFRNLLTDGDRIYFADFGLSTHAGFALDAAESAFVRRHADYDHAYTATHLTRWLVSTLLDVPWPEVMGRLRAHASDPAGLGLPDAATRIVARHLPVALVMGDFLDAFETVSKKTPFPAAEVARSLPGG